MSTITAMTESVGDVDVDEFLTSLMESGSCTAEVGLRGFLPGMADEVSDIELT